MNGLNFDNAREFLNFAYTEENIQAGIVYIDRDMNVYAVDPKDNSLVTNGGWLSSEEAHIEVLQNPEQYRGISIIHDMVAVRVFDKFKIVLKSKWKDNIPTGHDEIIGRLSSK